LTDLPYVDEFDIATAPDRITKRSARFGDTQLEYTSTAGRIPMNGPDGTPDAQMFFTAYTADGAEPRQRPITFLVNGGPGAATAWLHIGGLGPRKIAMNPDGSTPPPPAELIDNSECALDCTDLVFIDAPGTGFSRVASAAAKERLFDREGDLDAFCTFIQTYLRNYRRWASPLYLFGESYGAMRVAGLADLLVRNGVEVSGIVLLSAALDYHVLTPGITNDLPYVLALPTMAAIAAFHYASASDVAELLAQAEHWAAGDYAAALAQGSLLSDAARADVVTVLERFTRLPRVIIETENLRIGVHQFMKYLLADHRGKVGRVDGRLIGPEPLDRVKEPYYDPAMGAMTPAFASAATQFLRLESQYDCAMAYQMYSRDVASSFIHARAATYGSFGYPQHLSALQSALVKNPAVRVLAMNGIYDLATPYWSVEYCLDHMPLPSNLRANVTSKRLEAGHMAYTDARASTAIAALVREFVRN
jgi:carboxypeptidase C (cathepsin A)